MKSKNGSFFPQKRSKKEVIKKPELTQKFNAKAQMVSK